MKCFIFLSVSILFRPCLLFLYLCGLFVEGPLVCSLFRRNQASTSSSFFIISFAPMSFEIPEKIRFNFTSVWVGQEASLGVEEKRDLLLDVAYESQPMNHWFLSKGSDALLEIKRFLCTLTF